MSDPAAAIIGGLVSRGLPLHIAQGIAGNMFAESRYQTDINEAAPIVPGSRGGFGLNQWTGPRRRALEAEAARLGVPVSDLDFQLDYTLQELNGPEQNAFAALMRSQDATEAARVYSDRFLRPGIPHMDTRLREAARLAGMGYEPQAAPAVGQPRQAAPAEAQQPPAGRDNALAQMMGQGAPEDPRQNALAAFSLDPRDFMARGYAQQPQPIQPQQQQYATRYLGGYRS